MVGKYNGCQVEPTGGSHTGEKRQVERILQITMVSDVEFHEVMKVFYELTGIQQWQVGHDLLTLSALNYTQCS